VRLHTLDLIHIGRFHSGSALRRRAAFSLLTQRVQAREHFIRGLPRISTLRLGDCKLGVQVRLRGRTFRLLLLTFRQRALRIVELRARLLQFHRGMFGLAGRLLRLLDGRFALRYLLLREFGYSAASAEQAERAYAKRQRQRLLDGMFAVGRLRVWM